MHGVPVFEGGDGIDMVELVGGGQPGGRIPARLNNEKKILVRMTTNCR
jgi:hypothetical protein